MDSDLLPLGLSFGAGIVLGFLYFGSLWLTVRRLPTLRQPALFWLGSFFVRTSLLLFGIFLVGAGHWERMAVCLFAIILIRILLTNISRFEQPAVKKP